MAEHHNKAFVSDELGGNTTHFGGLHLNLEKMEGTAKSATYEEALDIIGFGRMQIVVLLVSGLIIMTVLTETMGMGLIMTAAHCDMELTPQRKGLISSVSFVGILLSSQLWGFLADTRGRRRTLIATMFLANACTLLSSVSVNFYMFMVTRFLTGIFISASSCVIYAYLGEFNTVRNRPTVIAFACIFAGMAYVYIPFMGFLILPQHWEFTINASLNFRPWRILILLNTFPGFLATMCLCCLPESGKFLIAQGNECEAINVLRRIYAMNSGCSADSFSVTHLLPEAVGESSKSTTRSRGFLASFWEQTVPLFKRPLRFHFLICCFLTFGVFFVSSGIGMWYPEIQNRIARTESVEAQKICSTLDQYLVQKPFNVSSAESQSMMVECNDDVAPTTIRDSGFLGVYYVAGYIVYSVGVRKIGQGLFLAIFLFASAIAGYALQYFADPVSVVALFSSHIVFSGVCISMLTGIVVSLIPTQYRGMAVSISMMFGRIGSISGSNLVGLILEPHCALTFYLYSTLIFVCGITSLWLPFR